ncbi:hypothetical protein WSM22_12450 [Cytophagales bacterium WSM2-2]|nr:hypothetical protein WSM22_12450 [Cytophagales bacterium WSM2-2]
MKSLTIFLLLFTVHSFGQTIKRAEYFFDTDPGKGSGTSLSVTQGSSINALHTVSIASLGNGPHTFSYRVLDSNGAWSHVATRTFFIITPVVFVNASSIKKAEYFFDHDPGSGSATPLSITTANSQDNNFVLNISSLTPGFHQLCARYQDNLGRWSMFAQRTFYIAPAVISSSSSTLKKAEYFFDSDPGTGHAITMPITAGSTENNLFTIDLSSLSPGFHQLMIRYQDNLGRWSLSTNRSFYIVSPASLVTTSAVKKAEYFFDHDPGTGHATPISITSSASQDNNFIIDISALPSGFHQLAVRYQDNLGRWSAFTNRTFYVLPGNIVSPTLQKIEYFIDSDPGINHGINFNFTPSASVNQLFTIDLGATPSGNHVLYVRTKDSSGYWSEPVVSAPFTIQSCTAPAAPPGIDGSRCDSGSVTLSANGATGSQQYRWYDDATINAISFTGPSFSTQSLNSSRDYYASIFDPSTGCESNRTKVTANVTIIPKPILSPSGALTLCQGNSVSIAAPAGYATYDWGSGPSTVQQITASTSASYTVKVSDGTCTSAVSDPLVLTIVPVPVKPIIQALGSTTICGSGSVTLTAPAGAQSYLWSTGETTSQIVTSLSGNYSVQISDANNCQSVPSPSVAVQVLATPTKPVVTVTGSTVLCNNSSVILSAPVGYTIYQWSNGAATPEVIVSTPGNYSVTAGNGTCTSPSSDPVTVTAGIPPSKPVVQITGSTSICGSGSVTLTAPIGFSRYLWSDNSSNQTLVANAAGNYSVQAFDSNNCQSSPSDQVVVKIVSVPTKPAITVIGATSLCINSSVILSAPQGFSNYQWSDGSITQQVVITTAGNYSVKVGNGPNCLSASSDAVTVSLTNLPCNSSGGNPVNTPPSITSSTIDIPAETKGTFDLKTLITKGSAGIDFSTLRIVSAPASGVKAIIDGSYNLILDYTGNSFSGKENIDIRICDSLNSCTERMLVIDVVASIVVFNAVSPHPDGLNDFFLLKYIDKIEETKKNRVTIVDRSGNEVFSISDYNNSDRVFDGHDNQGKELPSGTYYYRIDFVSGRPTLSGFLSLKR